MAGGNVSGELMEELYGINDTCFFATSWEGNDDLEAALFDWASDEHEASLESADENPVKLEALIRENGDETMAEFLNYLDKDLRRDALKLVVEYFKEEGEKLFTSEIEEQVQEVLSHL